MVMDELYGPLHLMRRAHVNNLGEGIQSEQRNVSSRMCGTYYCPLGVPPDEQLVL